MKPSFFKKLGPISISQIRDNVDCQILNIDQKKTFDDLVSIDSNLNNCLTFLYDNQIYSNFKNIRNTIICTKKLAKNLKNNESAIIVQDVHHAIAILSNIFYEEFNEIDLKRLPAPKIGSNCYISKNAIIENGAQIGNNVSINDGCRVGVGCLIGNHCAIDKNTVISNSILNDYVSIGRNCSIGQSGFGFYINNKNNLKIFHSGNVVLNDFVNIGSNCSIDRGSFSDTIIGINTYLDNLCHVAHNVKIGRNCIFAAMTGIAGSSNIGDGVMTGGQVGIGGHIRIGDNVKIAAKSAVFSDVEKGQSIMGNPAINKFKFIKKYKKTYE